MVSLVYERVLHRVTSEKWVERCEAQIGDVLDTLEGERGQVAPDFWFGEGPGHADIAVACALGFLREAHSEISSAARWPRLTQHADRCERLNAFRAVVQPFIPPS